MGPGASCEGRVAVSGMGARTSAKAWKWLLAWLDGRKNVLFLRWRGERYILHRATGFPYISYILPCRLNSFTRRAYGQGNGNKGTVHRATAIYFSYIHVLFLRWRGERYILHRATGFPYISYILPCRLNSFTRRAYGQGNGRRGIERELYFTEPPDFHIFLLYPPASAGGESATPKNVFFPCEEVLIYNAP